MSGIENAYDFLKDVLDRLTALERRACQFENWSNRIENRAAEQRATLDAHEAEIKETSVAVGWCTRKGRIARMYVALEFIAGKLGTERQSIAERLVDALGDAWLR